MTDRGAERVGPETPETFARRAFGDLYDRLAIMVLNDQGDHCWRPAPATEELTGEERKQLEEEQAEARVWLNASSEPPCAGGSPDCLRK